MKKAVIVGYARTPFPFAAKGALARVRPDDLAAPRWVGAVALCAAAASSAGRLDAQSGSQGARRDPGQQPDGHDHRDPGVPLCFKGQAGA